MWRSSRFAAGSLSLPVARTKQNTHGNAYFSVSVSPQPAGVTTPFPAHFEAARPKDVLSKDALQSHELIFNLVLDGLTHEFGRENLVFPKEILWLAGAPGAGKGTNCAHIMAERSITAPPIEMSALLDTPEFREKKKRGDLIDDLDVVRALFRELLSPKYSNGVVVDGFPRTRVQAKCIIRLYSLMKSLRDEYINTTFGQNFRRPIFHVVSLFVEEKVAVERQLSRGREALAHNKLVEEEGEGEFLPVRDTDIDENLARKRYQVFKEETYDALMMLRDQYVYQFVNASGSIEDVKKEISRLFAYQSALELAHETLETIQQIPLASDLVKHSRQQLVRRLDNYSRFHRQLFLKVIEVIDQDFMHIIKRQALTGAAMIRSDKELWSLPLAVDMALDILAERGYCVVLDYERKVTLDSIDPDTLIVISSTRKLLHFMVYFERAHIRKLHVTPP